MGSEEAYRLAIQACRETWNEKTVKQIEEALKQEPCEDAISRQAVKELYYKCGYIDFRKICELPPVNPQPKMGRWIEERTYMECPNCHDIWHYEENQTERFKFCPNCGRRMIEPQESE